MKKFLLAAAALVASASANAAIYVIDDFTTNPPNPTSFTLSAAGQSATDGPNEAYTLGGINYTRTVLFELLSETDPNNIREAELNIMGGELNIANDAFVKSRATLSYDISALDALLPNFATANFGVIFSDGVVLDNPITPGDESLASTSIQAFLNGTSIGTWTLTCPIENADQACDPEFAGFAFTGAMLTGTNDILQFIINGPGGYDLTVDQIAVVPEPGMVALFGLGLAGLGFARRRKTA